jgi:hypothetical protein
MTLGDCKRKESLKKKVRVRCRQCRFNLCGGPEHFGFELTTEWWAVCRDAGWAMLRPLTQPKTPHTFLNLPLP